MQCASKHAYGEIMQAKDSSKQAGAIARSAALSFVA